MTERRTPLYDIHLRTASKMVKGGGDYMYPLSYTSPVEEHLNTRTNVGMQDLSTMGEIDIKGPGAERLVNRLLVNEVRDMHPGQLRYSTMVNETGGIVDDITVYKFGDEHFMVVTSSGPRKKTAKWVSEHAAGMSAYVTDMSGSIALISVQGPRSMDFLDQLIADLDLPELRFFRFANGNLNDTQVLVSRSGYTGELGYELYIPSEEAAVVWEYLQANNGEFGLLPYGVSAMQSLRIEKAYPLYGPDIDETRTPFELGLNEWIRFDKRDFVGRDALLQLQDIGVQERWVGLELQGESAATTGDPIYSIANIETLRDEILTGSEAGETYDLEQPGVEVGAITSSARGHTVGKALGLGFVNSQHAWTGNQLLVEVNGRPTLAKVVNTPFFDPDNARPRARGSSKEAQ
ncbi:MAG: glycine cleavage system aminomethyltransferase GcvT [Anaerolineales bacterium]|jgi:aminomethyltransferase